MPPLPATEATIDAPACTVIDRGIAAAQEFKQMPFQDVRQINSCVPMARPNCGLRDVVSSSGEPDRPHGFKALARAVSIRGPTLPLPS